MNPNELLVWMSAMGEGTWPRYRTALDELSLANLSTESMCDLGENNTESSSLPQHHQFKLNLERLGHAEFFHQDGSSGWRVVPPTVIRIPGQKDTQGILCGARTDQLLSRLRRVWGDERLAHQSQRGCPDRIMIKTSSPQELSEFACSENLIFNEDAIERLLMATPPVDDLQLRMPSELPFGDDWQVSQFSTRNLSWIESSIHDARNYRAGLFRIRVRFRSEYFLKLGEDSFKLPVQVGKYLVLKRAHCKVLQYNYHARTLSMPVTCRPPLLLDRALTLCSGLIPELVSGRLVYCKIEPLHFQAAKRLLRQ